MAFLIRFIVLSLIITMLWRFIRRLAAQNPPRTPRSTRDPYGTLGLSPDANSETIRQAYQALIQQYHPDKVSTLGVEIREVALRRTQEITQAYAELKRRGKV